MRNVVRLSKLPLFIALMIVLTNSPAHAQKLMLAMNAGADVTDINTQMLMGMDVSLRFGSHYRFNVIGTDDFGQPGRSMYVAYALEYQKASGQLRPYVGTGVTLGNRKTDVLLHNIPGWLLMSGVDLVTRVGRPYLELRIQGDGVVHEHVMMGFRLAL